MTETFQTEQALLFTSWDVQMGLLSSNVRKFKEDLFHQLSDFGIQNYPTPEALLESISSKKTSEELNGELSLLKSKYDETIISYIVSSFSSLNERSEEIMK